jgi:hypothetical protein
VQQNRTCGGSGPVHSGGFMVICPVSRYRRNGRKTAKARVLFQQQPATGKVRREIVIFGFQADCF